MNIGITDFAWFKEDIPRDKPALIKMELGKSNKKRQFALNFTYRDAAKNTSITLTKEQVDWIISTSEQLHDKMDEIDGKED